MIATESGRSVADPPEGDLAVSVVTLAELELGVHLAADAEVRAVRMATLSRVRDLYAGLPVDDTVASEFAALTAALKSSGRRAPIQDVWIAATAVANQASVCTLDADFDPLDGVRGLEIIRL